MKAYTTTAWALVWHGRSGWERFLFDSPLPHKCALFASRAKAREYATAEFGYIKHRSDLRRDMCWRVPRPVKVTVSIQLSGKAGAI